jgi:uncharacterized protein
VPLISLSAHDIDTAGVAIDAELPLAWLKEELVDAELTGTAPGRVTARLSRSGNDIVVRGRVVADLRTPCARCLDASRVPVDTELSLLLQPAATGARPRGKSADEEYEFTSDEADVDVYDGETVVLDSFVREAILLEVPNFPLCSEDCPGIRPAAPVAPLDPGPQLDPRLAPLGALKEKLQAGPTAENSSKKKKE